MNTPHANLVPAGRWKYFHRNSFWRLTRQRGEKPAGTPTLPFQSAGQACSPMADAAMGMGAFLLFAPFAGTLAFPLVAWWPQRLLPQFILLAAFTLLGILVGRLLPRNRRHGQLGVFRARLQGNAKGFPQSPPPPGNTNEPIRNCDHQINDLVEVVAQASPAAMFAFDANQDVRLWNPAAERLFGWTQGEILGKALPMRMEWTDDDGEAMPFDPVAKAPSAEVRCQRKDGSWIQVQFSTAPILSAQGEIAGQVGVMIDITEQNRAEERRTKYFADLEVAKLIQEEHASELARLVEELTTERDTLQSLMDNLPDYIYFKDRSSCFIRINQSLAHAFGLSDPSTRSRENRL